MEEYRHPGECQTSSIHAAIHLTADDRIHTRHLNNFQYIPIILSKLSEI
jgi:hypothetical protein